jgi:hypothetical protein
MITVYYYKLFASNHYRPNYIISFLNFYIVMKKNKLTIVENWNKGLTLSKKEIGFLMAGDGGGTACGEPNGITKIKKTLNPSKACPCH